VALKDPNVILGQGGVDEAKAIAKEPESAVDAQINDFFSWWPTKLLDAYMADKSNEDARTKLLTT
jgi:hypothetical protein